MKRFLFGLVFLTSTAYAGLITHSDYNPNDVITAAKQNSNENAAFNLLNGNLDSTNIAAGGIAYSNLGATVTNRLQLANYRRPILMPQSSTSISVDTNTATVNESCVIFPDATQVCVTEALPGTYRTMALTQNANFVSGTEKSGLAPGYTLGNNTWYAIYAVKSQISSSNFVLVADTVTPQAANAATLNTSYGTNGWSYLGMIRYGDNETHANAICNFTMSGNMTLLSGAVVTSLNQQLAGMELADTANANNLSYSPTSGISGTNLPPQFTNLLISAGGYNGGAAFTLDLRDTSGTITFNNAGIPAAGGVTLRAWVPAYPNGFKLQGANAIAYSVVLSGWVDSILGPGANAQM